MKTFIQMLLLEKAKVYFFFDHNHQPALSIEDVKYTSLYTLCQQFPLLSTAPYLEKTAQIANFLSQGLEFQYIDDIPRFQEEYRQRLEAGQMDLLQGTPCLNDHGIYDTSLLHAPQIKGDQLIFFVKHDYTQLPYQASLRYPIREETVKIHYALLPYL